MIKDWKSNIGEYMAANGTFRLAFITDKLRKDCDEYISQMNSFNGIRAGYQLHNSIGEISFDIVLEIHLDRMQNGNLINAPFIMGIRVNEETNFYIMYAAKYEWHARIQSEMRNDQEQKDFHAYKIEEITEPERFEKEFMFQVINQRLEEYVASFNKN